MLLDSCGIAYRNSIVTISQETQDRYMLTLVIALTLRKVHSLQLEGRRQPDNQPRNRRQVSGVFDYALLPLRWLTPLCQIMHATLAAGPSERLLAFSSTRRTQITMEVCVSECHWTDHSFLCFVVLCSLLFPPGAIPNSPSEHKPHTLLAVKLWRVCHPHSPHQRLRRPLFLILRRHPTSSPPPPRPTLLRKRPLHLETLPVVFDACLR